MMHPDPQLLSAYLDGDLSLSQVGEVETHLAGCPGCRVLYRDLQEVQRRARNLPDRYPERDLWPEIARVIQEGESDVEIIELHPWLGREAPKAHRGFRVSYLQAAAAVLLALFSGAAGVYFAGPGDPPAEVVVGPSNPWVELVGGVTPGLGDSAREVVRLEGLLAMHRDELDPVTVRILEDNLGVIDQAILESLRALRADPGNRFLRGHLARGVESKVNFLREATAFVAPVS